MTTSDTCICKRYEGIVKQNGILAILDAVKYYADKGITGKLELNFVEGKLRVINRTESDKI